MQRAPSQRWTSTKSKNIYDDWSDEEEDSYDEDGFAEEDEDEYINQQQQPQKQPQKQPQQQTQQEKEQIEAVTAQKHESTNQIGAQGATKSTDRHTSLQIQDKNDSKSVQLKAEATTKRNISMASESQEPQDLKNVQQFSAPSPSAVPTATSTESLQTPTVESKHVKNENENVSLDTTTDSVESYRKRSEREHIERTQNLNIMEGLYKSISNQLSINNSNDTREDDKKVYDSDDQGWDDTDEEDSGSKSVSSHQQHKNMVNEKTGVSVEKGPAIETHDKSQYLNLEKGIDLDSSVPVSRPSLDIRPRPSSLVDGPEVKNSKYYSDTSRLDKNFEDLFEDFENLSFSTDPIKERTTENTPKKKENNALLTNLELDFQPLTPKRSPQIGHSVDDYNNNDNSNGSEGVDDKGLWGAAHTGHSSDNNGSCLPELQKPPTLSKDSDNDSIVDSIADSDNFNLDNGENKDDKSDLDNDYYNQNVSDSDDDNDGGFKASQGLWSQIPTDTTKKEVAKVASAGDKLPTASEMKDDNEKSLSDSIEDSDDYNKPNKQKDRPNEKVFGDNFPSKSFDLESVDTDSESVFRTSVYRNDFMNRTQQQQKHEVFDSAALSTSALEAAEKYQNESELNKNEPEKVNISTAKDILADESFSSNNTARPNTQGTTDISFAKEYLGLADDEDDEEEEDDDADGRGARINDNISGSDSDNDDAFKASGGLWSPNASVAPTAAAVGVAATTGIVAGATKAKHFEDEKPFALAAQERKTSDGSVQLRNFSSSDVHVPPPTINKQSTISTFGETDTSSYSEVTSNIIKEEKAEDRKSFDPATFKETILFEKSNDQDNSDDENGFAFRNGLTKISTNDTHDQTECGSTIPPGTPTVLSKRDSVTTPIRQTSSTSASVSMSNDSPAVPPKDLNMFTPKQYQPVKHNLQQIMNNTPEQVHLILRAVRKDEFNHDSGLHTWLEATLKTASTGPKYGVTQIGPNTKAAYDAAAAKSSGGNTNPTLAARRMSFNSKINISSHRFLKGTKNVNKNVKGKLEEGFAKSLFKRKK